VVFVSELYDPARHDATPFDCGEAALNEWLRTRALEAAARRTARTWVWTTDGGTVVGYYALASHRVRRDAVPSGIGRGGPAEIPAVLIARLALDESLRGSGLGAVLVGDALHRIVLATQVVAARLVVVDALHENVAGFYERLGFRRVPDSLMLVLKTSDAEAASRTV
jgi:GNAT superfamily N-acetyltransferase